VDDYKLLREIACATGKSPYKLLPAHHSCWLNHRIASRTLPKEVVAWLRDKKKNCKFITPVRTGADRMHKPLDFSNISAKEQEFDACMATDDIDDLGELPEDNTESARNNLRDLLISLGVTSEDVLRERQVSHEKYKLPSTEERVDRLFKQAVEGVR
jgi:hypothetical protein